MNEKQKIFVREYLKDFNGTRAYKVAYKSCKKDETARVNASRLLSNANIQQAIQEQSNKQLEEIDVDVSYIIRNIKEVTERCMQKKPVMYFDKVDKEWKQETALVEKEDGSLQEEGVWKFESSSALKGLELLGKYKAIFSENVNLNDNTKSTSLLESINKQLSDKQ